MIETYNKVLATVLANLGINHTVAGVLLDMYFTDNLAPDSLTTFFSKYDIETMDYQCVWLASKLAARLHYVGVPKEQSPRIKGIVRKFTVVNGRGLCELHGILGAFNESHVDAMLLNGTALKAFYEPEEIRFQSHIDIFVRSEDVTKAVLFLEEKGFSLHGKSRKQNVYVKNDVRVIVNSVYLHANILTGDRADIWKNSLKICWRGKKVFVPCPEMLLLILLVQGLEASCSRIRDGRTNHFVSLFLDSKFFLDSSILDWEKFVGLAKKSKLTLHVRLMLDILNRLYSDSVPEDVLDALLFTDYDTANVQRLISYNIAKKRMADARIQRYRKDYYWNGCVSLWNLNCYYGNRDSVFANMIGFPQFISAWNDHKGIKRLLSIFGGCKK